MRTYPEIGVADPHHPLTHHRNNPEWIEKVTKVNTLHMELFAEFIQKMKATPDGDGTLLDHSMIVYGSGIARRQPPHARRPAGPARRPAAATFAPGRHIVYPKDTPMTNLYLTLLDRMGVQSGVDRRQHRARPAPRERVALARATPNSQRPTSKDSQPPTPKASLEVGSLECLDVGSW